MSEPHEVIRCACCHHTAMRLTASGLMVLDRHNKEWHATTLTAADLRSIADALDLHAPHALRKAARAINMAHERTQCIDSPEICR